MRKITGFAILVGIAVAMHSQAALIVDFNSADLVTKTTFNGAYALDTNTAQHPGGTLDNTGQSIYSGFVENTGVDASVVFNDGSGGARLRWESGGFSGDNATALFLFKKDEFLNGLDTGTISMDAANDTVDATWSFVNGGVGATATNRLSDLVMRLVIQDSTGWHISDQTTYGGGTFSLEATTLGYFDYDPTTSLTAIGASEAASFTDIQFVGYYVDATRGQEILGVNGGLQQFSVSAIPEPSSLTLLLLGLAGCTVLSRRKK